MGLFKRAISSLKRAWFRSVVMFLMILAISSMLSVTIVISRGIELAEINLRRQIPPVATMLHNHTVLDEQLMHYGYEQFLSATETIEIIESVGSLPYVRAFNYMVYGWDFFSDTMRMPSDVKPYLGTLWDREGILETLKFRHLKTFLDVNNVEQFTLNAIRYHGNLDIQEEIIELIYGRTFTEDEINNSENVAVISEGISIVNNLNIGDLFSLDLNVCYHFENPVCLEREGSAVETFEFEVVGIFRPTVVMDENASVFDITNHMDLNTRIYVPIEFGRLWSEAFERYWDGPIDELLRYDRILFSLYDSLYLDDFYLAATEIIPETRTISDMRTSFESLTISMNSLKKIVSGMNISIAVTSFLVLGLIITTFIHARQYEIGIYLALGESRTKITVQFLIETMMLSVIAIVMGLFLGYNISEGLSSNILLNGTIENFSPVIGSVHGDLFDMGFGIEIPLEEMLSTYTIKIDGIVILQYTLFSFLMVSLSTVLPLIYIKRISPKKLLTLGERG